MSKYLLIVALAVTGFFLNTPQSVEAAYNIPSGGVELEGFAWSSTIGWISMNCSNTGTCGTVPYAVQINQDGTLEGYAWSSMGPGVGVGWIKFDTTGAYPVGSGVDSAAARVDAGSSDYPNLSVGGWARVCAAAANANCTGGTHTSAGGWDGWISLSGASSGGYGIEMTVTGATADSFAWGGSTVMGWIDFSPEGTAGVTYVTTPPVINTFVSTPDLVATGNPSDLTYDVTGIALCEITNDVNAAVLAAPLPPVAITVTPTVTTNYTLTCTNGPHIVTRTTTITVVPDMQVSGVNVILGTPDAFGFGTVELEFTVTDILSTASNIPYSVELGGVTQSGTFNPADTMPLSETFSNVLYVAALPYEVEVDMASPSPGDVLEGGGSNEINRANGTASASAGDPSIVVTVPDLVGTGDTADVRIQINAIYETTCTVFGPGFGSSFVVPAGVSYDQTAPSSPLTNATNFVVECTVPGGDPHVERGAVEVIPDFQEV
jgi:hypothetical protein